MAENDYAPWGIATGNNCMDLPTYLASPGLAQGVVTGIADPTIINRALRQATFVASAMATFSVNETGLPALDDGNLAEFVNNFTNAIGHAGQVPNFATNAQALAGTDTGTIIAPSSLSYVLNQKLGPALGNYLPLTGGTITGALAVNGVLYSYGGLQATSGLTVTGGAINFPGGSVNGAVLATGTVSNTQLAGMSNATVKANLAGGTALPQDQPISSILSAGGVVPITACHFCGVTQEQAPANSWVLRHNDWADPNNNIPGASVSGHQITLPAGRYTISISAECQSQFAVAAMSHKMRLRNVSAGTTLLSGMNTGVSVSSTAGGICAPSQLNGIIVFGSPTVIQLESYATQAWQGLTGVGSNGEMDVASTTLITRIAPS